MRYWKRPELRPRWAAGVLLLLFGLHAGPAAAARDIVIEHAGTELVDGNYRADARIRYELDENTLVALEHGVILDIRVTFRVRRERKWLWDPVVAESAVQFRLQHHPLSDDYVVHNLELDERHQFPSAEAALKYVGTIDNRPLIEAATLDEESSYTGLVRAQLNPVSLPAPLQPAAYVAGTWRLESSWYEWVVR